MAGPEGWCGSYMSKFRAGRITEDDWRMINVHIQKRIFWRRAGFCVRVSLSSAIFSHGPVGVWLLLCIYVLASRFRVGREVCNVFQVHVHQHSAERFVAAHRQRCEQIILGQNLNVLVVPHSNIFIFFPDHSQCLILPSPHVYESARPQASDQSLQVCLCTSRRFH